MDRVDDRPDRFRGNKPAVSQHPMGWMDDDKQRQEAHDARPPEGAEGGDPVDETMEFTVRIDKLEDRINDGKRYAGLLTKEDYDRRKKKLNDKLRQEADPEGYKMEKLNEAIAKEDGEIRAAKMAQKKREEDRKKKIAEELRAVKSGGVGKKGKKEKKAGGPMLSFDVDEEA